MAPPHCSALTLCLFSISSAFLPPLLLFLLPSVAAAVPPPVGMVVAEPEDDPPISKWHSGDSHSFPWQRGGEADDGVCQEVVFLGC